VTSFTGPGRLFPRSSLYAPHPLVSATLDSNLRQTLAAISSCATRSGRAADDVSLVAVTKSVGARTAAELVRLGQRDLGENRLPSLLAKRAQLEREGLEVRWHFIGHIQRNKARRVVQSSEVLHSVDSLRLIDTLERVAAEEARRIGVYLEVKLAQDDQKQGLAPAELSAAVERAGAAEHLELVGLMTMAPQPAPGADPTRSARPTFEELSRLARELEKDTHLAKAFTDCRVQLSMGMSGDYPAAIAAGSDLVRVGTALFRGVETDAPETGGLA
jgi:pyridoxal phosphate enzyme (YggS family)